MSSLIWGWGMWGMTSLWLSLQPQGLGDMGEVVVIVVRQYGGQCRGSGGCGGMLLLLLLGDAGAGDLGGCIILVVIAICHCWMMLGAGWAFWH